MKTILFLIAIISFLLIIPNAFAGSYENTLTFQWDWGEDCPTPEDSGLPSATPDANDLEWHLYKRVGEDGQYNYMAPDLIEPYQGDLALTYNLIIDELENSEFIRVYFVLRSFYSGYESDDSNEVYIDISTPLILSPSNLQIEGVEQDDSATCPAYYANQNVIWSWNASHALGSEIACDNSGNIIEGVNNNLLISNAYGENGNGALIDSLDSYLEWYQTENQYSKNNGAQTICYRIYVDSVSTVGDLYYLESDSGSIIDGISSFINAGVGRIRNKYIANNVSNTSSEDGPSDINVWLTKCYSIDPNSNSHAAYNGSEWIEDIGELTEAPTNGFINIKIGEDIASNTTPNGAVWIDRVVIMDGYKQDLPINW